MAPSLSRRSWRAQRRWVKNFDLWVCSFPIVELSGCLEFLSHGSHGQNGCSSSWLRMKRMRSPRKMKSWRKRFCELPFGPWPNSPMKVASLGCYPNLTCCLNNWLAIWFLNRKCVDYTTRIDRAQAEPVETDIGWSDSAGSPWFSILGRQIFWGPEMRSGIHISSINVHQHSPEV